MSSKVNSNVFCLAPWTHGTVAVDKKLQPCCVSNPNSNFEYSDYQTWWKSEKIINLRSDLSNGVKNSNCNRCWQAEDFGKQSLRQSYNKLFKPFANFENVTTSVKNKDFENVDFPTTWEIDIGNSCNLKCIMCDPIRSNKIQEEVDQHQSKFIQFPKLIDQAKNTATSNWVDTVEGQQFLNSIKQNLKWLKLQGGEALSVKTVRDLIENLDSQEVTLALTTNGTVLDNRLLLALSKFKRVEISISIEAIGPANDVIRYGSNWDIIEKNIRLLNECSNIDLQINHVLQNTSTLFLPDVIRFVEANQLHLLLIPLYSPEYLSLSSIAKKHTTNLVNVVEQLDITNTRNKYIKQYLKNIVEATEYNETLNAQFRHYISTLDQVRTKKITPWLEPILNTQ